MRLLLFTIGFLVLVLGFSLFVNHKTPIQELESFVLFAIAAIFFTGSAILDTMFLMLRRFKQMQDRS